MHCVDFLNPICNNNVFFILCFWNQFAYFPFPISFSRDTPARAVPCTLPVPSVCLSNSHLWGIDLWDTTIDTESHLWDRLVRILGSFSALIFFLLLKNKSPNVKFPKLLGLFDSFPPSIQFQSQLVRSFAQTFKFPLTKVNQCVFFNELELMRKLQTSAV